MNAYCSLPGWPTVVEPLLDRYLQRLGIASTATRTGWIEAVAAELHERTVPVAPEELAEDALEILQRRIRDHLIAGGSVDPDRLYTVLLYEPQTGLLNALLEPGDADIDPLLRERLHAELAVQAPRPVPAEAPLAMPEQSIARRSPNPARRRSGKPA